MLKIAHTRPFRIQKMSQPLEAQLRFSLSIISSQKRTTERKKKNLPKSEFWSKPDH